VVDDLDEKLINFKSKNLLNQMLPYANNNVTNQNLNNGKRKADEDVADLENGNSKP
jgi:hypothetical protein